jgi:hypothetical protein
MNVEHRIAVAAPAETIFRIYEDVGAWSTWDPDTKHAFIDGPFRVGGRGRLTPTRGRAVPIELTEVVPGRCFTVESRIPLFRMRFEHLLSPVPVGTEVLHRVTFSGPLSFLLGPMLARRLAEGLPVTLSRLKSLAEAQQAR